MPQTPQTPDPQPGFYYVSMHDHPAHWLLSGPYATHQEALDDVSAARDIANYHDARTYFYGFGTCRCDRHHGPGRLNQAGLMWLDTVIPQEGEQEEPA